MPTKIDRLITDTGTGCSRKVLQQNVNRMSAKPPIDFTNACFVLSCTASNPGESARTCSRDTHKEDWLRKKALYLEGFEPTTSFSCLLNHCAKTVPISDARVKSFRVILLQLRQHQKFRQLLKKTFFQNVENLNENGFAGKSTFQKNIFSPSSSTTF